MTKPTPTIKTLTLSKFTTSTSGNTFNVGPEILNVKPNYEVQIEVADAWPFVNQTVTCVLDFTPTTGRNTDPFKVGESVTVTIDQDNAATLGTVRSSIKNGDDVYSITVTDGSTVYTGDPTIRVSGGNN